MSVSHGQQQKQTQKHETAHAQKTRGLKVTLSCHVRTPEGFHYLPQEGKKIHRTLKQKPKQIDFFLASWHLKAGSLIPAIIAGETLTKTHTHTQTYSLASTGRMQKHNSQEYLHLSASACSVTAAL